MRKNVSIVLIIFIWIAFAWRVHAITEQSLWRDEVDAIFFALRPLADTVAMFKQTAQNGPLYFLSLRPWFRIVGSSEFALRFPSALAGTLSIPLLFQVARLLVDSPRAKRNNSEQPSNEQPSNEQQSSFISTFRTDIANHSVPLAAAFFFAINPYQLWYGQEGKMYALIVALALLSSWFWLQGINRGDRKYWVAYLITTSISIYSHLLMVLIIPLHFLWFFIAWPQSRRQWKGYALALCGLTLPYLPMVLWQWDMLISTEKRTLFTFVPLEPMLKKVLFSQSRGPEHISLPHFEDPIWLAPIFFLGLAGLLLGIGEIWSRAKSNAAKVATDLSEHRPAEEVTGSETRSVATLSVSETSIDAQHATPADTLPEETLTGSLDYLNQWHRYGLIVSWLLVPIAFIYLLSTRQPVFVDRYIIWIAPAAMIILALGLKAVWRNAAALSIPLTAALVLYLMLFWGYVGWQQKTTTNKYDLRSAITFVAERRQPNELLILQIPHVQYSYQYYSSDQGTDPFDGSSVERLGYWTSGLYTNRDNHLPEDQVAADVDTQMQGIIGNAETVWVIYSEAPMWDQKRFMEKWLEANSETLESEDFYHAHIRKYKF